MPMNAQSPLKPSTRQIADELKHARTRGYERGYRDGAYRWITSCTVACGTGGVIGALLALLVTGHGTC